MRVQQLMGKPLSRNPALCVNLHVYACMCAHHTSHSIFEKQLGIAFQPSLISGHDSETQQLHFFGK